MSNYQSESGHINLTQKGYNEVVSKMREEYNAYQDFLYDCAVKFHDFAKEKKVESEEKAYKLLKIAGNMKVTFPGIPTHEKYHIDFESSVLIVDEVMRGKNESICKPRKSAFQKLTSRDKEFRVEIYGGTIHFTNVNGVIDWDVEENNHALRNTYECCMVKAFFNIINNRTWGKTEGGIFYEHNEYMDEGDKSVTHAWGRFR